MNEFVRKPSIEESFFELHGIKPKVEYLRMHSSEYRIRLSYNNRVIVLKEILDHGITKEASVEYDGAIHAFPSVYEAECWASNILRG